MSQYLEFFIRHKDVYLPIASFCGSSSYMEAFDGEVPSYSGLAPVDKDLLGYVQAKAEKEIKDMKDYLAKWEREKHEILQSSNTLEEKMEYINEEEQYMDEYEAMIEYFKTGVYNGPGAVMYLPKESMEKICGMKFNHLTQKWVKVH